MKVSEADQDLRQVPDIERVVEGLRYRSLDATCIAQGWNPLFGYIWLLQTQKGNLFHVWKPEGALEVVLGGALNLKPLSLEDAKRIYGAVEHQIVSPEVAFGDRVEDA